MIETLNTTVTIDNLKSLLFSIREAIDQDKSGKLNTADVRCKFDELYSYVNKLDLKSLDSDLLIQILNKISSLVESINNN